MYKGEDMENKLIAALREDIKDKRVLILGFGREGKGSFEAVMKAGGYRQLAIADQRDIGTDEVHSIVKKISDMEAVTDILADILLITGENYLNCIDEFDIVMKTPGVVLPKLFSEYRAIITSQTEYFLRLYGNQTIGITGTKGKSTTTTLICHELKESGHDAVLLGNIGIPAFDRADEITEESIIVFELSCHQLEYGRYSPHIAVYLNVFPEHLDHYESFEKYRQAKENIYKNQNENDVLYCGSGVIPAENEVRSAVKVIYDLNRGDSPESTEEPATFIRSEMVSHEGKKLRIDEDNIRLKGLHNLFDVAVAFAVCMDLGISREDFYMALISYKPLPHRLEFVGNIDGIKFYDDSISTVPETAIEAMNTIKDTDTIILGGMDRGIDYTPLIEYLENSDIPNIILMETTGARIYEEIKTGYMELNNSGRVILTEDLEEAVKKAKEVTSRGSSCVMSPAAASYGIFKDFEERGEVFKRLVRSL